MKNNIKLGFFERISVIVTKAVGTTAAFVIAAMLIVIWVMTGPIFNYSDTWQLVINTTTTIITFLMVFVIQRSQNKESMAIQLKLDELLAAVKGASVDMINVEQLSEEDLNNLLNRYGSLVQKLENTKNKKVSVSVTDLKENEKDLKDIKEVKKDLNKIKSNKDKT